MTGQRAFTRIFQGASSRAREWVARLAAPFEALYQVRPGRGRSAAVELTLRITPPPASRITGAAARTKWKIDFTFTRNTRSKSSSVTSISGLLR